MRVRLWIQQRHESPCASSKFQGIRCPMIGGEGDGVSNWTSSGVIGERSIEDEEMSLVDDVLEGALGALGCRNGGPSRGHGGLWWLMMDEEDGELVICIWREFIRRDFFENGINLNRFRLFQIVFEHSG
ncbi:hypothetical protein Tco_0397321 [Tanacetum coccineum]